MQHYPDRWCPIACILPLATVFTLCAGDATPQQLRERGLVALKAAQADESRIVEAARLLSQAADAYAAKGEDAAAEELNAYLYWAKKKMTLQQMDALLGTDKPTAEKVIAKLEAVEKKAVKPEDAAAWLARADGFAEGCKDPFLSAVRYFEVAERFAGAPESLEAQRKSLSLMQQVKAAPPPVAGTPAEKGDGKVYVQSVPAGAAILIKQGGELRDTGAKTPGMVSPPRGLVTLVLRLQGYEDAEVGAVSGDAIAKPEPAKLEKITVGADVTASTELGEGWSVFVDGKPILDSTGKPAVAPCTTKLAPGTYQVALAKEGFNDPLPTRLTVKTEGLNSVEVKGRAARGASRLMAQAQAREMEEFTVVGTWKLVNGGARRWYELILKKDGTFIGGDMNPNGKWEFSRRTRTLTLNWYSYPPESFRLNVKGDYFEGPFGLQR